MVCDTFNNYEPELKLHDAIIILSYLFLVFISIEQIESFRPSFACYKRLPESSIYIQNKCSWGWFNINYRMIWSLMRQYHLN